MDIPNHKESVKAEKALKDVVAEKNSADGSKDKSNAVDVSHSFGTSVLRLNKCIATKEREYEGAN